MVVTRYVKLAVIAAAALSAPQALAAPTYWVARALVSDAKTGGESVPLVSGNSPGDFITSKAACEKIEAAMVAAARKNGLKAIASCIATMDPTSFQ